MRSRKFKIGFFSFTEITDPAEHHSYNEWHMLDHMPEQYPIPGIVYGQRWVSTPACRAARAVSGEQLDPVHYLTCYLMTEPVEETLKEFYEHGRAAREGRPLPQAPARAHVGTVPHPGRCRRASRC